MLTERADRCGFSKSLKSMRKVWVEKYKKHLPTKNHVVSAGSTLGMPAVVCIRNMTLD